MPDYYNGEGGMQPFDVIDAFRLDFYEGNVVKYICRWRRKNGLEDLYKARTYINEVIKRAEAEAEAEGWCGQPDKCEAGPGRHRPSPGCRVVAPF